MLVRKKPKLRFKPENALRKEYHRHRRYVRAHNCVVPGCEARVIRFCHLRLGAHAGKGQKPPDWWGFPACDEHHMQAHNMGEHSFQEKYGIDLNKITAALARNSPDRAMKENMNAYLQSQRSDQNAEGDTG